MLLSLVPLEAGFGGYAFRINTPTPSPQSPDCNCPRRLIIHQFFWRMCIFSWCICIHISLGCNRAVRRT